MPSFPEPDQTSRGPAYEGRLLARPDDEIVDQGAGFDLATIVTRRRMLGLVGLGIGAVTLAACSSSATSTTATDATSTGTSDGEIPEETNGPYPADGTNDVNILSDSGIVRSDITTNLDGSGAVEGVPLTFTFTVTDMQNDNAPFEGVALYAWQCDAQGLYSMYSQGVEDDTFLRGIQVADADGKLTFTTIVPGCYTGRWTHIHFEVYPDVDSATEVTNAIATSQLAFPADMLADVYALDAYSGSSKNLAAVGTQPSDDDIFGEGDWELQLATITGDVKSGYTGSLNVAIDTSTAADRGGSTGGGGGGGSHRRVAAVASRHRELPRADLPTVDPSGAERRQVLLEVTGLADAVHGAPPHHALAVEQERPAQRTAGLLVEHPVRPGDRPVRPVVGEQVEVEALGVGVRAQREHGVAGDPQHPRAQVIEPAPLVAQAAQLAGADRAERPRVEEQDRRSATQSGQGDRLAVLVAGAEVGRDATDLDPSGRRGHRREPRGRTSLCAAQSGDTFADVVRARPAVTAASEMSELSTYPVRPTFGVNSHRTPVALRSTTASTRPSTRSPSSSRHHSSTTSTASMASSTSSPSIASSTAIRSSSSTSSSQPSSWTT